ncbi:multidrug resistance efflux transporter family protein [Weissella soli]|uniref:multidrug resistance efflux transporter family protein n=1 Tax=Weissella soli TaxID=155866 RepID=UPI003C76BEC3
MYKSQFTQALLLGILAALFFSVTFILNQVMNVAGSYWLWNGTLRYLWMLPLLLLLLMIQRQPIKPIYRVIKSNLGAWILWSNLGFVGFYLPLVFAADYLPGWLVSSIWQLTIIFGVLTSPLTKIPQMIDGKPHLVRAKIPLVSLPWLVIIAIGVEFTVVGEHGHVRPWELTISLLALTFAAIAYPLGNRKIMPHAQTLTGVQRVFAMTLCAYPTFLMLSLIALLQVGLPSAETLLNTFFVGLSSGVIATVLFYKSTSLVAHDMRLLAQIEATQALEVVFSVILSFIFLGTTFSNSWQILGLIILIFGVIMVNLRR